MDIKVSPEISAPDIEEFERKVKELAEHASRCRELVAELAEMELSVELTSTQP